MSSSDVIFEAAWLPHAAPRLEALIAEHSQRVLRTAWRMLGSSEEAEDVAQEVFLRLHQKGVPALEGPQMAAWLYRVTVNACWDVLRRRKAVVELTDTAALASTEESAEKQWSREEQKRRLERAIARLPERERAALVLRELEGLPGPEVAAILDCTEETVRTSIFRAKEKLRRWMS